MIFIIFCELIPSINIRPKQIIKMSKLREEPPKSDFFIKICIFWKNDNFVKNILVKTLIFFSCDFDIFDGGIGCAKFHADEIFFSI